MKKVLGVFLGAALVIGLMAASLFGGSATAEDATPMASPMAGVATGAVFMTISNGGAEADALVAASTDVSEVVEIHEVVDSGGVMQMKPLLDGLEIPAGETVLLEPGGYHIMLIGLTDDLVAGSSFSLEVEFTNAGTLTLEVLVFADQADAMAADLTDAVTAGEITVASVWSRQAPGMGMGNGHMHGKGTPTSEDAMGTPTAGGSDDMMSVATGAVFMTVANAGSEEDRLISATSDAAETVEVHEVKNNNGVMEMRPLSDGLAIPAGESVVLQPGGYHIMLIGLTGDLNAGESFAVTLTFEKAGDVTVEAAIVTGNDKPTEGLAEPVVAGDITVSDVWSRAAPA